MQPYLFGEKDLKLVIVESPGKIKKLKSYLGSGWEVMASVGHVRDLPENDLGVDLGSFKPVYVETKKDVIKKLKARAKQASEVWLATDLDREGEAISWHLGKVLRLNNPKRIVFNEITKKAVSNAISNPGEIDIKMVAAQEARRVVDRLVGYRVSGPLSQMGNDRLSAGRVQSVVVKLVVERDEEINRFTRVDHFSIKINIPGAPAWSADLVTSAYTTDEQPYIVDRSVVERLVGIEKVEVIRCETKPSQKKAPGSFMTSTLQQAASVQLKMSTDETMKAAQTLYEKGFITYHRTDFPNISMEGWKAACDRLKELGFAHLTPGKPNLQKVPEGSQEAHEAIRPADYAQSTDGLDSSCRALYELIVSRTLASQMKPAEYDVTKVLLKAIDVDFGELPVPKFSASGRVVRCPGWRALTPIDASDEKEGRAEDNTELPEISEGTVIDNFTAQIVDKKTSPPAKYTEASLIKFLEKAEIGRPSTWASIMKNITNRGYIVFDKRKISATEKGANVVYLLNKFAFMDYGFTKKLEADLDSISQGKRRFVDVVQMLNATLDSDLLSLGKKEVKVTNPCPLCGKQVNRIPSKGRGHFWGCSGYRDGCSFTAQDKAGKMLTSDEAQKLKAKQESKKEITEFQCTCGAGSLIKRPAKKKRGRPQTYWYGCSEFPKCKNSFFDKGGKPNLEREIA